MVQCTPKLAPLKRVFKVAKNRLAKFKDVFERFKKPRFSKEYSDTVFLKQFEPVRRSAHAAKRRLTVRASRETSHEGFQNRVDFAVQLFDDRPSKYDLFLQAIAGIISKLSRTMRPKNS